MGTHFSGLYLDCPRKFHLKYLMGLKPAKIARALNFGVVMHEAQFQLYKTGSLEWALEWFAQHLLSLKDSYSNAEHFTQDYYRGPTMFEAWASKWYEEDTKTYNFLALEQQLNPVLANGIPITVRPDRVFQHKDTGQIVIPDTKTTSYTVTSPHVTMEHGQQATSYIWALSKEYPLSQIDGVMVDTIFSRVKSDGTIDPSKIQLARPMVRRTAYDLQAFELSMIGITAEIAQKVHTYLQGTYPAELLFPRPPLSPPCSKFNCEYETICRRPLAKEEVPFGFVKDPWVQPQYMQDMLLQKDSILSYIGG
jgi:hypothetical protein